MRRLRSGSTLVAAVAALAVAVAVVTGGAAAVATAQEATATVTDGRPGRWLAVTTVPAMAGVTVTLGLQSAVTDGSGRARLFRAADEVGAVGVQPGVVMLSPDLRARLVGVTEPSDTDRATVTFNREARVTFAFRAKRTVIDPSALGPVHLTSSIGERLVVPPGKEVWLQSTRALAGGHAVTPLSWSVQKVEVAGSNVVHQQRFVPESGPVVDVSVLFFSASFHASDALFSFRNSKAILLEYPDGSTTRHKLGRDQRLVLHNLPRGAYQVTVIGPGLRLPRPLALSRDQNVDLKLFSWFDIGTVLGVLLTAAAALVVIGRRMGRRKEDQSQPSAPPVSRDEHGFVPSRRRHSQVHPSARRVVFGALALTVGLGLGPASSLTTATAAEAPTPAWRPTPGDPLVLAHYYIWFNASSWNRAKRDYPSLGRYSSDEATVMRRHVDAAIAAGIDGFIVSWKSTPVLDERLRKLVAIAAERRFRLAIGYQALDFQRAPLPLERVAQDLDVFLTTFAPSPVFDVFGKPLVIWMGTRSYSDADVRSVTASRRDRLQVFASETSIEGYERLAGVVDGDLYYWTAADPVVNRKYAPKLATLATTVRSLGGRWIAPVSPGFDARMVGGSKVIDRRDGETLRAGWDAALGSSPDAIGIISWNEFSENTHIETSRTFGSTYLDVVRDLTGAPAPSGELDSSSPGPASVGKRRVGLLVAVSLLIGAIGPIAFRRSRRRIVEPPL